jgi:hypothetical protein
MTPPTDEDNRQADSDGEMNQIDLDLNHEGMFQWQVDGNHGENVPGT